MDPESRGARYPLAQKNLYSVTYRCVMLDEEEARRRALDLVQRWDCLKTLINLVQREIQNAWNDQALQLEAVEDELIILRFEHRRLQKKLASQKPKPPTIDG